MVGLGWLVRDGSEQTGNEAGPPPIPNWQPGSTNRRRFDLAMRAWKCQDKGHQLWQSMTDTTEPPSPSHSSDNQTAKRITITIPNATYEQMVQRSNNEGRSISHLAADLLERGIDSSRP